MKKTLQIGFYILISLFIFTQSSCQDKTFDNESDSENSGNDSSDEGDDNEETLKEGLTWSPENPDADSELTINFKAPVKSKLYGYMGDVYIHTGVITQGVWAFVPAEWNENIAKCKMTKKDDNCWSISLSPSIREWFASGETAINKLGIVIRSSDGSKKGIEEDSFIEVTDNKYTAFQPAPIIEQTMPAGTVEGINISGGSSVTFAFYDKDKNGNHKDFAYILGDFNNWTLANDGTSQMYRDNLAGCWWITVENLDPEKEYRFQYYTGTKDGDVIRLADAYSEKILDPDNDKYIPESTYPSSEMVYPEKGIGIVSTFKINKDEYPWHNNDFKIKDIDNLLIYELHLRDFTSTSDLNGAISKLDYLEGLGINAIELMPVQEFDGNDSWGYNPCFFFAMDKAYGTKEMYKRFIDECHNRGIAVLFDVVYNHATGAHPFAKLYWDSKNNKTAANNPWFNVDAPHPYGVFHDFNHESELVKTFVKRNLKFLLDEYKIDGFRFDLTKGFTQRQCSESTASDYDGNRIAVLKDYYDAIHEANENAVVILEHFCCDKEEKELADYGLKLWRNGNNAYCQSGMGWQDDSGFEGIYTGTNNMKFGGYISFMESHDEERTAFKAKEYGNGDLKTNLANRMKSMATNTAFFLTVPGPKMIWQFGEMGYDVSIEENGRTGRKPLHWEYLNDQYRKKLTETYTLILKLRNKLPQLFSSDATFRWEVSESYWEGCRNISIESIDGKKLFIVGNFTTEEQTSSAQVPSGWSGYYNFISAEQVSNVAGTQPTVAPHDFVIYSNFLINN
ncbi:alpha-amylase family glycosyl hydrolase [uncultured Bacteroides sp.]|uniref:alpha-amylase family glycosyl hydrolase n=1 Tax=uncultured Bacteroides sp. TaxID=162156 RepID=UPI002612FDEF|nr:alpha-amylase family glycosyl hydrolase [uncultured Bacteroides sp.]